jgi:Fic family protein
MGKSRMTELESLLADIDAMKTQLDAVRPLTNDQLQLALDIEYTYESNRIEGNTLTLRETDLVINKGLTVGGKSLREHLEAINHYEAILYIRELATQGKILDEPEIRNIHALVLRAIDRDSSTGKSGFFRYA